MAAQPRGPNGRFICVPAWPRKHKSPCGCGGGGSHPCPVGRKLRPLREAARRAYRPAPYTAREVAQLERHLYGLETEREALGEAIEYARARIGEGGSKFHGAGQRHFRGTATLEERGYRGVGSEDAYRELLEERRQLLAHDRHLKDEISRTSAELRAAERAVNRPRPQPRRRLAVAGRARRRGHAAAAHRHAHRRWG